MTEVLGRVKSDKGDGEDLEEVFFFFTCQPQEDCMVSVECEFCEASR